MQRRALEPHDPDAADAPALQLLGDEEMAVHLDRLTFGRDVAADGEHEAADGVPVPGGQLGTEDLVHLVHGHLARDPELAAAERHDQGLVDVELVDDLADELLDQVLEGHDAGGAAVLVDDDGEVELAGLHLAHEGGDPFGLGDVVRRSAHLAHRGGAPCRCATARIRSLVKAMPTTSSRLWLNTGMRL